MPMTPCEVCGGPCNSKYSVCRENEECRREYQRRVQRKYVEANQDAVRERAVERYQADRDAILEGSRQRHRRRRQDNPEEVRAAERARYRNNPVRKRASGRAYYQANRDVILEQAKVKRQAEREEELARQQEYHEAHPEEACQICGAPCTSEYAVSSRTPECKREQNRRRRDASPELRAKELAGKRAWRRNNPEKEREQKRRYGKRHPERVRAATEAWREKNQEKLQAQARERYRANRDELLEYGADYRSALRSTVQGTARLMFFGARDRSKRRGLPFDLTMEWVEAELARALENGCPLLGIGITLDTAQESGRRLPGTPSIDRFRPELGYVQDNCWILSWAANKMKYNMTIDFVRKVIAMADTRFRSVS